MVLKGFSFTKPANMGCSFTVMTTTCNFASYFALTSRPNAAGLTLAIGSDCEGGAVAVVFAAAFALPLGGIARDV